MNTEATQLSLNEVSTDGFWTLYLSVIFLVIVITVATLLRPPANITPMPTHAERASFGITVVPLPLGNIDSLDPSTIGVITSMVTNHNLTARILIGGDPASADALRTANAVEAKFQSEGICSDSLKAFVTQSIATQTAEVHFKKDNE